MKRNLKSYTQCDSNSVTFWRKQTYGDRKKDQRLPGVGGGMKRWRTGEFQDSETTLNDIIMVNTCPYALLQTHRM